MLYSVTYQHHSAKKYLYHQHGQILIVMLVLIVLALGSGVLVANKFYSSMHTFSNVDSAARALAVSEAAIEHILLLPMDTLEQYVTNRTCTTDCHLEIVGEDEIKAVANITLAFAGNTTSNYSIELDSYSVSEINLQGYAIGK